MGLKQSCDEFSSESRQPECAPVCVKVIYRKIMDYILFFVLMGHL